MPSPIYTIVCPSCQAKFRVPASLAGQTTDCPRCKQPIAIPASFDEGGSATASGPPPISAERDRPARQLAKRRPADDYDDNDDDLDDDLDDDDRPRRRRRRLEPHRGQTIMIMGILSIFVAQLILGPITWVMANSDLKAMREGRMDPEGKSNTETGRMCAIVSVCLSAAFLVMCCGFSLLMIAVAPANR